MKNKTLIQSELWMIKWLKLYTAITMKPLPPKSTLTFLWRVLPHIGSYQSQDVVNRNEQWFEEGEQKPSQTTNEIKPSREKRQVTTLAQLCPSQLVDTSNSPFYSSRRHLGIVTTQTPHRGSCWVVFSHVVYLWEQRTLSLPFLHFFCRFFDISLDYVVFKEKR